MRGLDLISLNRSHNGAYCGSLGDLEVRIRKEGGEKIPVCQFWLYIGSRIPSWRDLQPRNIPLSTTNCAKSNLLGYSR